MFEKECVPFAPALIESMRSLGYSFPAAIADLIDNSISADAKNIDIIAEPSYNPTLIILDDGCGMSKERIYEAMRYGSRNPLEERQENDLGRFGLGLKSASLSQCRKLIVVSKQDNMINAYSWDLDYVVNSGSWMLKGFSEKEINEFPEIGRLEKLDHGTYVYLSEFDRVKESTNNIIETFNKNLVEMSNHLSLVFHRFIDDGLNITVNNSKIVGKDPFLSYLSATQRKKESSIYINNEKIVLKPYILPHMSKLNQSDLDKVGGKDNLKTEQGFYVYRNKRLIIWGTWFRLERKDELNKLARVRVDIPNSLDYMWAIDIKKSTATLPDIIKKNMYSAVYDAVAASEKTQTYVGTKSRKSKDITYIWERIERRDSVDYVINRESPQLKILIETLDDKQIKLLETVLETFEEAFPSAALYVDAARGELDDRKKLESQKKAEEDALEKLNIQLDFIRKESLPVVEYCKLLSSAEPFCHFDITKERLKEEISKYE